MNGAASGPRPEFSRPLPVEEIGEGVERQIEADAAELKALAGRMKLPAVHALSARLRVEPRGRGGFVVRGRMQARVRQECVRTLEPFDETLEVAVERLFVPPDSPQARALQAAPVVALDADAPDAPDIIEDGVIDLGELLAEHLALALDPWPKKPGTDFVDVQVGAAPEVAAGAEHGGTGNEADGDEERRNPFAVLRTLKRDDDG